MDILSFMPTFKQNKHFDMKVQTDAVLVDTLPDFFPATTKLCVKPSEAFFKCFSEKSVKSSDGDIEAGARGLKDCMKEKADYVNCMNKNYTKDAKRHRVGH
jgi:hypothetical protein